MQNSARLCGSLSTTALTKLATSRSAASRRTTSFGTYWSSVGSWTSTRTFRRNSYAALQELRAPRGGPQLDLSSLRRVLQSAPPDRLPVPAHARVRARQRPVHAPLHLHRLRSGAIGGLDRLPKRSA